MPIYRLVVQILPSGLQYCTYVEIQSLPFSLKFFTIWVVRFYRLVGYMLPSGSEKKQSLPFGKEQSYRLGEIFYRLVSRSTSAITYFTVWYQSLFYRLAGLFLPSGGDRR